jgi:acetoin utilization deacetylase AcuC-like enzyme|tara:strand:- start:9 stop:440 length:432 start_codon:yes stop_codon:yes gene_type:complete
MNLCKDGDRFINADTIICKKSYDTALLVVGAVLKVLSLIHEGTLKNGFCAVRPPSHHAESNRAMGFYLFNSVAISARFAVSNFGLKKIFIIDWDVHHGNGTQNAFYTDSRCFLYFIAPVSFPGLAVLMRQVVVKAMDLRSISH